MRILYIANARMPTEKAHGLQIAKMVEAFVGLGNNVNLLLPRRRNNIGQEINEYYGISADYQVTYLPNLFDFLWSLNRKIYFMLQQCFFTLAGVVYALLKSQSHDIIFSREIKICFFLSLFGKKVIFEDHEPPKSKRWLYKYFLNKIHKKVIVPYNLENIYRQYGVDAKTYIVAPNGVDLDEFDFVVSDRSIWSEFPELTSDDRVILYIGHFYPWKGVYTLISSARYMTGIKVVLIGGTDEDRSEVEEYIKKNNLKNVLVSGFKKHKEIIKYIKSADVLVLPNTAKEERSQKYTTPIKLFEYIASGVPIVASRVESFARYLKEKENCLMFEPDNARDLAGAVDRLVADEELGNKISNQALGEVKDYTWEERARKIINFIKFA